MNEWKVNLGDRVKDRINGFVGIVTGRADFLYGCRQVVVAPENLGSDMSKHPDGAWLDEDRVEVVEPAVHNQPESASVRAGGPQPNMPRRK